MRCHLPTSSTEYNATSVSLKESFAPGTTVIEVEMTSGHPFYNARGGQLKRYQGTYPFSQDTTGLVAIVKCYHARSSNGGGIENGCYACDIEIYSSHKDLYVAA